MKQSRSTSLLKSVVSTAAGFGISLAAQWLVLPILLGAPVALDANLKFAVIMTVLSVGRGYVLERIFEMLGWRVRLSPFVLAVLAECVRQREVEGWTPEHDDTEHSQGVLAQAGAAYLLGQHSIFCERWQDGKTVEVSGRLVWPWDVDWWKPSGLRRDLVKGCALGIAEGEKFDRNRKRK